jgi:hypothetical protein
MKSLTKALALILALMLVCTACAKPSDPTSGTTATTATTTGVVIPPSKTVCYNIIFALATVPPVLAALDAIKSGNETYAIIERGKTYGGIDELEYFHNAGFDPKNNLSSGFTEEEFIAMTEKVKELKGDNVYFNIYVQDGTAMMGAGIAANAGLGTDDFHVYMCEDGTGAYNALYNTYVKDKTVSAEKDEIYDTFTERADAAKEQFELVMSKSDDRYNDWMMGYDIGKAYALASLPNFTYCIQDRSAVEDIVTSAGSTKLSAVFGITGYSDSVPKLNLRYAKIAQAVSELSPEQRTDYLTLMYGDYYAATYETLTRTERAGEKAPDKKLVFIGARHAGYPDFVSNVIHGTGGSYAVAASYAELDAKYKTPLIFPTEADYNVFLGVINNMDNYVGEYGEGAVNNARWACFNYYVDYIFTLKLTYALYGKDYDVIMKGHPRESIGDHGEWGGQYLVGYGDGKVYCFDKLMDNALLAFHESDSVGKYIGAVPYGTSAENLAYLGADLTICGLPSSTYNGYDTDVDVLFILAETNEAINGSASQVKSRYEAGNLGFTGADGEKICSVFYNTGSVYKAAERICREAGKTAAAESYAKLFAAWLAENHPGFTDIDAQGFPVK